MATLNRKKLTMILGMLGSTGDGEVLNAAKMAHSMITKAGLTWSDIIPPASKTEEPPFDHGKKTEKPSSDQRRSLDSHVTGGLPVCRREHARRHHNCARMRSLTALVIFGRLTAGAYRADPGWG